MWRLPGYRRLELQHFPFHDKLFQAMSAESRFLKEEKREIYFTIWLLRHFFPFPRFVLTRKSLPTENDPKLAQLAFCG